MVQLDSGMLVLSQRDVRFFGFGMMRSNDFLNFGPASAMYLLWKAYPDDLTALAKVPSATNSATNLVIDSGGPEIVTLSLLLWHAAVISAGARVYCLK